MPMWCLHPQKRDKGTCVLGCLLASQGQMLPSTFGLAFFYTVDRIRLMPVCAETLVTNLAIDGTCVSAWGTLPVAHVLNSACCRWKPWYFLSHLSVILHFLINDNTTGIVAQPKILGTTLVSFHYSSHCGDCPAVLQ